MDIMEINRVIEALENNEQRDEMDEKALQIYKTKRNEYYNSLVKGVTHDHATAHRIG